MQISTIRFGTVEIDAEKILSFAEGLPGLEEYREFIILQLSESYPVVWMQSTQDAAVCLPVIDSFLAAPDYTFNLSDEDVADLELTGPEDLHVLSVVVIPEEMEGMTMNLAAPIIVNMKSRMARQVILSGGEYNVRYPVFNDICRLIREEKSDAGIVTEDK